MALGIIGVCRGISEKPGCAVELAEPGNALEVATVGKAVCMACDR